MKKLNLMFMALVAMFFAVTSANAASALTVCSTSVTSTDTLETANGETCRVIKVTTGFTLDKDVIITNKVLQVADGQTLTVDAGKTLTFKDFALTDGEHDSFAASGIEVANLVLGNGSTLDVKGKVVLKATDDWNPDYEKGGTFAGKGAAGISRTTGGWNGTVKVEDGGSLEVSGYQRAGIGTIKELEVSGTVKATGNGNGVMPVTTKVTGTGSLVSSDNKSNGLTTKLTAEEGSDLTVNDNGASGATLEAGSSVSGKFTATGNTGTDLTTKADNGSYAGVGATGALTLGAKSDLEVGTLANNNSADITVPEGAEFTVDKVSTGSVKTSDSVLVEEDYDGKGTQRVTVEESAEEDVTVTVGKTTLVVNKSEHKVNVYTVDTKTPVVVENTEEGQLVEVVTVTLKFGKTTLVYKVFANQSLSDLKDESIKTIKGYQADKKYLGIYDESKKEVGMDTKFAKSVVLTAKYEGEKNPDTGDSVLNFVSLGVVSFTTLMAAGLFIKKNSYNN